MGFRIGITTAVAASKLASLAGHLISPPDAA